jgi:hypothetical protein
MKLVSLFLVLLFSSCLVSSFPPALEEEWEEWKEEYLKTYGSEQEEDTARASWWRNRDYVITHNSRDDVTFTVKLNQFADVDFVSFCKMFIFGGGGGGGGYFTLILFLISFCPLFSNHRRTLSNVSAIYIYPLFKKSIQSFF